MKLNNVVTKYLHVFNVDRVEGILKINYYTRSDIPDFSIDEFSCLLSLPEVDKILLAVNYPHKKRRLTVNIIPRPITPKGFTIYGLIERFLDIKSKHNIMYVEVNKELPLDILKKCYNAEYHGLRTYVEKITNPHNHEVKYYVLEKSSEYTITLDYTVFSEDNRMLFRNITDYKLITNSIPELEVVRYFHANGKFP